jgi:hypothetical protein
MCHVYTAFLGWVWGWGGVWWVKDVDVLLRGISLHLDGYTAELWVVCVYYFYI